MDIPGRYQQTEEGEVRQGPRACGLRVAVWNDGTTLEHMLRGLRGGEERRGRGRGRRGRTSCSSYRVPK